MRRVLDFLCLCALFGCGSAGEDAGPAERLQGTWVSESDQVACAVVLNFEGAYFEIRQVCELMSGSIAIEVHSGSFTATDRQISYRIESSTCPDPDFSESPTYSFEGERLQLVFRDGVVLYERPKSTGGGTGSADFGCFDEEGFFERRPLQPI